MSEAPPLSADQLAQLNARLQRLRVPAAGAGAAPVPAPVPAPAPAASAPAPAPSQAPAPAGLPRLGVIFFSGLTGDLPPYELLLDVARYADQAGFHAIWTPERHFTEVGGAYPNPAVLAAALATVTRHVRLRAGSINLPLHDPLRVAEEWAVVDQLSQGRVDLSVAPGWHIRDFVLKPENFQKRFDLLNQYREQLQQAWRGEPVRREDAAGGWHDIVTYPRPVQATLPLWLTTSQREEAWAFAGRQGLHVLTALINFGPQDLERRIAIYREARRAAGHDPAAGTVSLMLHTYVDRQAEQAVERVRPAMTEYLRSFVTQHQTAGQAEAGDKARTLQTLGKDEDAFIEMVFDRYVATSSLIGDVRQATERLQDFARMGVDEVACLVDFGLDKSQVLDSLQLLSALNPRNPAA